MTCNTIISLVCAILLVSCTGTGPDSGEARARVTGEFIAGNFIELKEYRDSIVKLFTDEEELIHYTDSLILIAERIEDDFSIDQHELNLIIERQSGINDPMQIDEWEEKGWLEYRIINGRKMYFNRAVSNLWLLRRFYEKREQSEYENSHDPRMQFRRMHDSLILAASGDKNLPVLPVEIKISYTLTVEPDAVPAGETVRCWLPWPKASHERQKGPELISVSAPDFIIAPDSCLHRTIYMEEVAEKGKPVSFAVSFRYLSYGQKFHFNSIKANPYSKETEFYKKYTAEKPPQITFNEQVRELAGSIPFNQADPKAYVRDLYLWFKENITWTGALEYSTMPDIPAYVYEHRRGDCGMQTLLFMSVLRFRGIPVRWQSGWMVPPGAENLHDGRLRDYELRCGTRRVQADLASGEADAPRHQRSGR